MKGRTLRRPMPWTILHGVLWIALIGAILMIVPRAERVFADFGVALPVGALWTIKASHALTGLVPLVLLGLAVLLAADFELIRKFQANENGDWPGVAWIMLMTALPIGAIVVTGLSIIVPLWNIDSGLRR